MSINSYRMYNNKPMDLNNTSADIRSYMVNSVDNPVYNTGGSQACKVLQPAVGGIYIDYGTVYIYSATNFTISAWIKFKNVVQPTPRLHGYYSKLRMGFVLYMSDNTQNVLYYSVAIPHTYNMSVWHHYRVSKANYTYTFYIDNVSIGSFTDNNVLGYPDIDDYSCYFVVGDVHLNGDIYKPIFDEVTVTDSNTNTYNSTTYYTNSTTIYDRSPENGRWFETDVYPEDITTDTVVVEDIYNWRPYAMENIKELTEDENWINENVYLLLSNNSTSSISKTTFVPNSISYSPDDTTYNISLSDTFLIGFWIEFESADQKESKQIRIQIKFTNGNIYTSPYINIYNIAERKWLTISRYDGLLEVRIDGNIVATSNEKSTLNLSSVDSYILINSEDDITPILSEVLILSDAIPIELLLPKTDYYQPFDPGIVSYYSFSYIPSELEGLVIDDDILFLKIY